jgi:tetratricopeptide (TPR) repeat protein
LRGRALIESGKAREAIPVLREGLAVADRRGDTPMVANLCYALGMGLYNSRSYDEALIPLRRALDEAMQLGDDPVLTGKITVAMGHALYMRDDIEDAIECYARAREQFSSLADLNTLACVYSGLSRAYQSKGDLSSALRYSKLSVAAFEANHNARGAANELNGMAVRYQDLGNLQQALECGREAVERARQVSARDLEALAHSTLAAIHLKLEDVGTAAAEARVAEALSASENDLARIDAWLVLAEIAERESETVRADELYQKALLALQERGWQAAYAEAALAYSLLLRRRGETNRALEYALEAAQARPAQSA